MRRGSSLGRAGRVKEMHYAILGLPDKAEGVKALNSFRGKTMFFLALCPDPYAKL